MNRQEYLEWAKARAIEYLDKGESRQAIMSIISDLIENPETKDHPGIMLGILSVGFGLLSTPDRVRHFIDGF